MNPVNIAPLGWQLSGWDSDYYPQDIPPDWRLAFYANDFSAVVLPEAVWLAPDNFDDFVAQLGELDDEVDFAVYAIAEQLPAAASLPSLLTGLADRLSGHFVGLLIRQLPADADWSALTAEQQSRLILPMDGFTDSQAGRYWCRLDAVGDRLPDAVLIKGSQDLRELRRLFEHLLPLVTSPSAPDRQLLVLVDDPDCSVEFLQQLRTLLELMGIA